MIFELMQSRIDQKIYMVIPDDLYLSGNEDVNVENWEDILTNAFPNQRFNITSFGQYDNAVRLT
jgi:hypothetical protein